MKLLHLAIFLSLFSGCVNGRNSQISSNETDDVVKQNVWNTVRSINKHLAFTENMDSLALFIHDDMVMFYPGGKNRLEGKENIMKSYKDYTSYAETIKLEETDPKIQLYNNNKIAVVTYYFDFVIKIPKGEIQTFSGKDMYTLVKENDRWYAVAQHYSFF
jgi:ketosteroid isomerase-like protein